MQLPSRLCCFHKIEYGIRVENDNTSDTFNYGPFQHTGSAIFRHDIDSGLKLNMKYLLMIELNSSALNTMVYSTEFSKYKI